MEAVSASEVSIYLYKAKRAMCQKALPSSITGFSHSFSLNQEAPEIITITISFNHFTGPDALLLSLPEHLLSMQLA
jgi:hypothetical protein